MKPIKHPCFDRKTMTDCPRRHSGCAVDCPDWATYSAERDKEYDKRAEVCKNNFAIGASIDKHVSKKLKRIIDHRAAGFVKR